jgi:uncharacterized protein
MRPDIDRFLASTSYAVAGASRDPQKYGNRVFQALTKSGRTTFPLNPVARQIENIDAYPDLKSCPFVPHSLSIVTPPEQTALVIQQAIELGVTSIWIQPGAEHDPSSQAARAAGINVIDDGSCILVALALRGVG